MIDLTKHNRAIEGLNKWKAARGRGTLEYITGFGKTRVGLLLIRQVLTKYPLAEILILVPSVAVGAVWVDAINAEDEYLMFTDAEKKQISIKSEATVSINDLEINYKLLIVDEVHKFTAPERYKLLSKLTYTSILGLTGTYPTGSNKAKLDEYCPVVDTIYEQEALANKWISQFREYNIPCYLTDEDKERYEKFSIPIRETLDIFKNVHKKFRRTDNTFMFDSDYSLINACKSGVNTVDQLGRSLYISATDIRYTTALFMDWSLSLDLSSDYGKSRNDNWHPDNIKVKAFIFADFVSKRNEILINNQIKADKVVELIKLFPNKTICFNESTFLADTITDNLNKAFDRPIATVYHTNITSRPLWDKVINDYIRYGSGAKKGEIKMFGKTTLRNIAIDGLRTGEYTVLLTAKALDEGLDIPSIEQVITTAGTANPIQYAQRGGRGKRVDAYNPNKVTKIFNLYFEDFIGVNGTLVKTRDKQKLINNQRERGSNVIWISDINLITED